MAIRSPVTPITPGSRAVAQPRSRAVGLFIDGRLAFVGSANLTGAGMGAKHADKRNFEAGFEFDDPGDIGEPMGWIDELYLGEWCRDCRRRDHCPDPIADRFD